VLNVDPTKAGAQAGLQSGDVITALDQHQVYNLGDFWHSVMREGEPRTMQLTVQGKSGLSTVALQRPSSQKVSQ
jgi:S1-C subfamily serine protease